MMGLGPTGPIIWLLGALAMIVIWGGVWWGLSALVFHWPARERSQSGRLPQPSTLQPSSGHPSAAQPSFGQPSSDATTSAESDNR